MLNQMTFLEEEPESLALRICTLENKLKNIRSGLFKRYEEQKRAIEFLENEIEDLVKETITNYGT